MNNSCQVLLTILVILLVIYSICPSSKEHFGEHIILDETKRKSGIKNSQDFLSECGHNLNCYDSSKVQHPGPPCVGKVPGMWNYCAGAQSDCTDTDKNTLKHQSCDWCASMNHPHFDVDDDTAKHLSAGVVKNDKLDVVIPFKAMNSDPDWGGGWSKKGSLFDGEACSGANDCRSGKCDWSSGSGKCVSKYKYEMSQAEQKAAASKKKGDKCSSDNDCSGNLGCCWYNCSTGKVGICDVQKVVQPSQKVVQPSQKVVQPSQKVVQPSQKVVQPSQKDVVTKDTLPKQQDLGQPCNGPGSRCGNGYKCQCDCSSGSCKCRCVASSGQNSAQQNSAQQKAAQAVQQKAAQAVQQKAAQAAQQKAAQAAQQKAAQAAQQKAAQAAQAAQQKAAQQKAAQGGDKDDDSECGPARTGPWKGAVPKEWCVTNCKLGNCPTTHCYCPKYQ